MSLRKSPHYKNLTPYMATGLAEGFESPESKTPEEQREEVLCAWQYLHDTKQAYRLQGFFGRTCQHLINEGLIEE